MTIKSAGRMMVALGATVLMLFVVNTTVSAARQPDETTHDGKVVSITGENLLMAAEDDTNEHSHQLTAETIITLDGTACKAAVLKPGNRIRVTTRGADKNVAIRVEALDKNKVFASNRHEGKMVSIAGTKLVMTGADDQKEHAHTLHDNVKITCDGKAVKFSDLKPGMKIRVTAASIDPLAKIIRIEGIDKNAEFASDHTDGKVISITGLKLVMTGTRGKEEFTHSLTENVKFTLDGKVCKSSDLKPGMRIRVTSDISDPAITIRIEALDRNPEFASL